VARGTLNAARLTPRDILVRALAVNAASVAVAHNHPSGSETPSRADRQVTAVIREACSLVGIPLLDHVIVTDAAHYSFRETEGWGC
jgi:DNA repair protein RadC